jgi:hypothetical protein
LVWLIVNIGNNLAGGGKYLAAYFAKRRKRAPDRRFMFDGAAGSRAAAWTSLKMIAPVAP